MTARSFTTLALIASVIVVLGVLRSRDAEATMADPATAAPATAAPATAIPATQTPTTPEPAPGAKPPAVALPSILDFGRGECLACKQMMPVLDAVRDAHALSVEVRYLDLAIESNRERADAYRVRLIPTQIFLAADGRELFRHEGFLPQDQIEQKLVEFGWITAR